MKSTVALVRCHTYEQETVDAALRRAVELLGGIGRFAGRGERIVLKPNVLAPDPPGRAVTTHPAVLTAAARLLQEAGARVAWGDSPGIGGAGLIGRRPGLVKAAREAGIELADFDTAVRISFPEALLVRQIDLARGALEADGLVSLPKMKPHGLMRLSGAMKNTFGCVPGMRKGEYHVKMPAIDHFAAMLVDLNRFLKPRLHVMDGILAMEGNGPRAGTPRKMGALFASADPAALDAVFCRLVRLNPEFVPTMKPARQSGFGTYLAGEIEIRGDDLDSLAAADFQVERDPAVSVRGRFPVFLKDWVTPRPVIDYDLCTNCGICVEMCPVSPKAVDWHDRRRNPKPIYKYKACIRCYCCQEICPYRAISIRTPLLGKIIHK